MQEKKRLSSIYLLTVNYLNNLSNSYDSFLSDMREWRDETWNWKIIWRRDKFSWEAELVDKLMQLVHFMEKNFIERLSW